MARLILTGQARQNFSEFPATIDEYALARYFTLTAQDRQVIGHCRGDHNRLGFACQLGWLRWLGWQPNDKRGAPQAATEFLASQLNLSADHLADYPSHVRMWQLHAEQVRQYLGWRTYQQAEAQALTAWLSNEALQYDHARGLLEAAVGYLRREQIVRSGLTILERVVAAARVQAEAYLAQVVEHLLTPDQQKALDALIALVGLGETSRLQWLKEPPGKATAKSLLTLLDKIEAVRALGLETLDLSALNPNRRKALAREAMRLLPVELRRLEAPRRYVLLASLLAELMLDFNDQAVETHDQLMRELFNRSEGRRNAHVLKRGQTFNAHTHLLRRIGQVVLDEQIADADVRAALFKVAPRTEWRRVVVECEAMAQPEDYNFLAFASGSYSYLRQFGPRFLGTLKLQMAPGGEAVFKGVEYLHRLNAGELTAFTDPPIDFIPYRLRKTIINSEKRVDRRLWELTLHDQVAQALRAGELWIEQSADHAPLSQDLRVPEAAKIALLQRNPHLRDGAQFLQNQQTIYLETLKRVNALWPSLEDAWIEDGQVHVSRLTALPEPDGTEAALQRLYARLPHRKLAHVFREVLHWVDYLEPLREAAGDDIRIEDLEMRLLALLMAEGCNIGLSNMAAATPGLTYLQLAHVAGRCLYDDVLEKAIAHVINFYDRLPIACVWGEGIWSSADGQLVATPVRTLYARLHPRAPKGKRVLNLFTYVYDRLMPYWGRVIETTAHESAYELDGLLHHEADIHPHKQAVDTAGYTDTLFGLTSLLSIFYAPRIKDLADQRLFYFDKTEPATFANVGPLLDAKINTHIIKAQWDKLIELVAAVEQGLSPASRVLRKLQAAGEHNALYRALQEVGRIAKTIYLLNYLSDQDLRRQVERQLNKTETYNSLANVLFWGQRGEMRLPALQDQLNRASCLRLVAAMVILFNAAYLQAAVKQERAQGNPITDEQLAHIFPTATAHINLLGEYSFRDEPALATRVDELPLVEPPAEQLTLNL